MAANFIETLGYIIKEETLKTIENEYFKDVFLLESIEPYPGYHGKNLPEIKMPKSVFLITKENNTNETITRATSRIKKYYQKNFDAVLGEIKIFDANYSCIRIKLLDSYQDISELTKCYQEEGISFSISRKLEGKGIIRVRKFFVIKEDLEGIYADKLRDNMSVSYFTIPKSLSWYAFTEITESVKQNVTNKNFDAALGAVYRCEGLMDIVRIYQKDADIESVKTIKDKYHQFIERYS